MTGRRIRFYWRPHVSARLLARLSQIHLILDNVRREIRGRRDGNADAGGKSRVAQTYPIEGGRAGLLFLSTMFLRCHRRKKNGK